MNCLSSSWLAHLLHCFSERSRASSLWWLVGVTLFQWVHIKATLFKRIYEPCPMTLFFTWFIFCGCNGYFFVCHRFLWQHIFIWKRPFMERLFATGLNIIINHSSKSIWVIKLSVCQNDSPMGGTFWQKDSLITCILFKLWLIMIFRPVANFTQQSLCLKWDN